MTYISEFIYVDNIQALRLRAHGSEILGDISNPRFYEAVQPASFSDVPKLAQLDSAVPALGNMRWYISAMGRHPSDAEVSVMLANRKEVLKLGTIIYQPRKNV